MKSILLNFILGLLIIPVVVAGEHSDTKEVYQTRNDCRHFRGLNIHSHYCLEYIDLDYDDGTFILTHRYADDVVEITEEYELYINDRRIDLNSRQEKLVAEYYHGLEDLTDYAAHIGIEGAKIGIEGAALGIKAIGSLFKLLSSDYDTDDLEREMERESAKIEYKAEKLEHHAEKIELIADDIEDIFAEMEDEIDEIRDLDWD
jgi:hypothetical protein